MLRPQALALQHSAPRYMPALALILHLIDGVAAGTGVPVSRAAAAQAAAWCEVGLEPRRSARGNGGVICRWV